MRIEEVQREGRALRFKVVGEDHTLCNLLRKTLYEDENVEAAAYRIEHPLLSVPEFYVRVKRGKPEEALLRALKRLEERLGKLEEEFKAELKNFKVPP
ncbi:MAG: DNA-directed RNA polymerase subunit L [Hadesarchaea archaeon]|jgi:DNA-directed RNA polymerase subunit L|nr:DNA-directed RNA polymerase subunit L [Hadesarchaea archaeon]TDA33630.1 MAG: DNA-directed RNA polymerase subunit L [Hadesarchaea archaeon]